MSAKGAAAAAKNEGVVKPVKEEEQDSSPTIRDRVAGGEAFKVIVIGNSDVGKTRLTYIYANGELPPKNMKSTVGVGYYGKTIPFFLANKKGEQVAKSIRISFYDTAGQEKYDAITVAHYRKSMGAIVAYSVTDRSSFDNVEKWLAQVKENADPNCATILLANKCDVTSEER